ncbi:MAG: PilZ domain-containing protein [Kofleriaceae bacterium]|nr:PilZ domain-containing protein [Kofleriaceae bacterium]
MSTDSSSADAVADNRRAGRLIVNAPAIVESIGQAPMSLHPNLAAVYRRVQADADTITRRFPAVVRDLSTNGAFIAGVSLPLMARVALRFDVTGVGKIDAIGWVMWLRSDECKVPTASGTMVTLPKGFGVLFESMALDIRNSIARLLPT